MNDRVSEELLAAAAKENAAEVLARVCVPELNFLDFISAEGGLLTTDSTMVAAVFKKPHDAVLKSVRSIVKKLPAERLGYFYETSAKRPNPNGGGYIESPAFKMTRDGFTLLAMSFTGERAFAFKLGYMDAFNAMSEYLKNQRDGLRFRCIELELEDKDSKRRGSHHAKGLSQRKREKKVIDPELAELKDKVQPKLV